MKIKRTCMFRFTSTILMIYSSYLQLSYQGTAKIPGFRQWMGVDPLYMTPAAFPMYNAYVEVKHLLCYIHSCFCFNIHFILLYDY
jgi:hypothetical protein